MKNYGYIRVAAVSTGIKVAGIGFNEMCIESVIDMAYKEGVSLLSFPELSLTGYSCGDLFGQTLLLERAEDAVKRIIAASRGRSITSVIGVPVQFRGRLYDCAAVIHNGNLKGLVPKIHHADARERRWFSSGSDFLTGMTTASGILVDNGKDCVREGFGAEILYAGQRCCISPNQLFETGDAVFAVEIGSDIDSPVPPSSFHTVAGAHIIVNLAADNAIYGTGRRRAERLKEHSRRSACAYIFSSGWGESTQDTVYPGAASIWEAGELIASQEEYNKTDFVIADIDIEKINSIRRKSSTFMTVTPDGTTSASYACRYNRIPLGENTETDFSRLFRHIEPHPFAPEHDMDTRCREILAIQVEALSLRLNKIGAKAVIGISGGLDSTLALLVTVLAFDRLKHLGWKRQDIVAVTMPGFGTTSRTKNNAWDLMQALGVTCREISIVPACEQHFMDIGHDASVHDATYENSQARERTQILMDIANQTGGIVVGTGDLSELALGWATYNGDHMSMYGVNAGIPKTLVRSLVKWAAENRFNDCQSMSEDGRSVTEILMDIVDTPISPELLPADENGEIQQVTEDLVGPYELHDFFIYNFMQAGYSPEKILFLATKAFAGTYDEQTILKWLKTFMRRFFSQQFKRSCMPDGPAADSVSLSPRGGWIMPSDAWSDIFADSLK